MAKNPGPLSTSIFKGIIDVLPLKWRSKLQLTKTERAVELTVEPDDLTTTLVASAVVQEANRDERRKINYEIQSPVGESIVEHELGDSGVNAAVPTTVTTTLVAEGTALPAYNHLTVDIDEQAFGDGLAERKVETVASYPVRAGQELDQETGIITSFTEQIQALGSGVGSANTISTPVDGLRSNVRTIVLNTDALNDFFESAPEMIDLSLPSELTSVDTYWSQSSAVGTSTTASSASGSYVDTGSFSYSVPARNENSSSASLLPTLIPQLKRRSGEGIPCRMCLLYVPSGTTISGLATRLTSHLGVAVSVWPRFDIKTFTIILKGQKIATRAAADANLSVSESDNHQSLVQVASTSESYDISDSVREYTIGPCICPTINLVDTDRTIDSTSTATSTIDGSGGFVVNAEATKQVEAEISPTTLAGTSQSSVPDSGYFLYRPQIRPYRPGWFLVRVAVFDAGDIPDA